MVCLSYLSPAPHALPQAAGLSDAPQALPAVFSFHPAMFDNAMIFTSVKLISVGPIAFLLS